MDSSKLRDRVLKEINLIPEDKLAELYDFIHHFRLGIEEPLGNTLAIMQFAGCWNDMSDEIFADFALIDCHTSSASIFQETKW